MPLLLRTTINRCLGGVAGLVTILSAPLAAGPASEKPTAPPPGRLVDIGGYRLHLYCTGKGRPTVILLSGLGAAAARASATWGRVQPEVAKFTRVCSYDRAGEGWSDPSPARESLQQTVNELHRLLLRADVKPPYVLAGQSWGGPIARVYASQHPERVVGMVLIDTTHEDAQLGVVRLGGIVRPRSLSPTEGGQLKADLDLVADTRENRPYPLGDLPLIVLAAGKAGEPPPGVTAEAWQQLADEKRQQRVDQARLSRNSKLIIATRSGHEIHQDDPPLVIAAIREVVEAARQHRPLRQAADEENAKR
jgi:pimeloyl-ACP methyl ester carboxylesterase